MKLAKEVEKGIEEMLKAKKHGLSDASITELKKGISSMLKNQKDKINRIWTRSAILEAIIAIKAFLFLVVMGYIPYTKDFSERFDYLVSLDNELFLRMGKHTQFKANRLQRYMRVKTKSFNKNQFGLIQKRISKIDNTFSKDVQNMKHFKNK